MVNRKENKKVKRHVQEEADEQQHVKDNPKKNNNEVVIQTKIKINEIDDEFVNTLLDLKGDSILVVTESDQLNLFGQAFRPIFCGTIFDVTFSHVTLFPVQIKMINAPFFEFPTPLSIPLEKIAHFTPNFDCDDRIPLT
ncbi:hypothetical protein [Metabacillus malikii]|uniref:Uncharacterized protein n=1 Tax=Metabacillus malikii TaxID=1504265 RepID=A0ABT9ZDU7_9BACI|nr:hypothetical protein [Metabacillus malikii]MDQ0230441.1 hypothetical protein [Metabacillus malikii]